MKLTIILTVYNKEQYLRRALDSLLNQYDVKDGDYEVLAVNDGSTDGSAAILSEYALNYRQVRVLTQQNQGLSMARNNGVEAANGEYVWFVDADDRINERAVKLICEAMLSKPDIIPIYAKLEGVELVRNCMNSNNMTGKDILRNGVWDQCGVLYIIRKCFLKREKLSFIPGIFHEDSEFTPRMLYKAGSVRIIPEVLYTIYRDPNSITQVPRPKRAYDCLIVANNLEIFMNNNYLMEPQIKTAFHYHITQILNSALFVISQNNKEEQKKFNLALFERRYLIHSLKATKKKKYYIEGVLFELFPHHCVNVYNLLRVFVN